MRGMYNLDSNTKLSYHHYHIIINILEGVMGGGGREGGSYARIQQDSHSDRYKCKLLGFLLSFGLGLLGLPC